MTKREKVSPTIKGLIRTKVEKIAVRRKQELTNTSKLLNVKITLADLLEMLLIISLLFLEQ
jgi:hypothetical protein